MDFKQYLISFLATLKGDKMVVGGLTRMRGATVGVGKSTDKTKKSTESYTQAMGRLTKRALLTIPVWLALRQAFMGLLRLIGSMIRGYLDLEDGLARIKTVMQGTTQTVNAQIITIKSAIKDMATKTRVPMKELAEAFYFLKTASLTTEEAMSAFIPTVNAMTGTGIKAKEMARAVAGVYNTMGKYILEGATASEKFQKIADVLTYTYATQDVQMDELIQGYTKLAPFIAGLSDSFSDLVSMIGWLNTRMLRAGRTGRLTARAFLQITKNADKLASIFKITFDPSKPLNFMEIMGQINEKVKTQGKLTAQQTESLRRIFATRALSPVQLIIQDYDDLVETQKRAVEEAENFAEKMAELKMATVRGQTERLSNVFQVLFEDLISAMYGMGDLATALDKVNEGFIAMREEVQAVGDIFGWATHNMSQLAIQMELMSKIAPALGKGLFDLFLPGRSQLRILQGWRDYIKDLVKWGIKYEKPSQYFKRTLDEEIIALEENKKKRKELEKVEAETQEKEERLLVRPKREMAEYKQEIQIMKILGASALDIAKYRWEEFEAQTATLTPSKKALEYTTRRDTLLREELKYRKELVNTIQKAELNMLKTIGATQIQILEYKERQLLASKETMGTTAYQLELDKLRLQQSIALRQEKQKEWELASSLYIQYEKAGNAERVRIRRVIELTQKKGKELAIIYKRDMYDKTLIKKYWGSFSKEQKDAINRAIDDMHRLAGEPLPLLEEDEEFKTLFTDLPVSFADNWLTRMKQSLATWKEDWDKIGAEISLISPGERLEEEKIESEAMVKRINLYMDTMKRLRQEGMLPEEITRRKALERQIITHEIKIGDITISISGEISEELAKIIAGEVEKEIRKSASPLRKAVDDAIEEY